MLHTDEIREAISLMNKRERSELLFDLIDFGYIDDIYILDKIDPSGQLNKVNNQRARSLAEEEYPLEDQLDNLDADEIRDFANEIIREG